MSLTKKIAYNTVIQVSGRVLSIFFGILTIGIMTRDLGVSGFGMYTKVLTFFQVFGVILDLGLYNVTLKLISHEDDEKSAEIVNKVLTLRLIINALFFIVPFFSLLLNYEPIVKQSIFIYSFAFLFSNLPQIFSILLQKKLDTAPFIISELFSRLSYLILVFVIAKLNFGLKEIMIANTMSALLAFFIVFFAMKKYMKVRLIFDREFSKEVLKSCWPFALSVIFNLIYFRADTFLLTILKTNEDVGIYSAAYKVLEIYISIPSLFVNLILPILDASYKHGDLNRFNKITQKIFDFFSMVIFPIIVGGALLSKELIVLLAGNDFVNAGPVLAVLCIVMGIITMSSLYTNTVIAVNQQKNMMFMYLSAAMLSLILYGVFIPIFSYQVIPYLKIVVEGFILITSFILTYRKVKKLPSLKALPKIIISSLIMGAGIYVLKYEFNLDIFITLPSAILIYFGTLFAMGGIDKEIVGQLLDKSS